MDNRPTIAEVQEWVLKLYNTCEQTITSEERKEQHKYKGGETMRVKVRSV